MTPFFLTSQLLVNHTNYHSFMWQKEDNLVKFRAKQLPQDKEFVPRAGIRLLKEDTVFLEVEAAEFRTHEIPFDRIFKSVSSSHLVKQL